MDVFLAVTKMCLTFFLNVSTTIYLELILIFILFRANANNKRKANLKIILWITLIFLIGEKETLYYRIAIDIATRKEPEHFLWRKTIEQT